MRRFPMNQGRREASGSKEAPLRALRDGGRGGHSPGRWANKPSQAGDDARGLIWP
jgi:hypothetical protein